MAVKKTTKEQKLWYITMVTLVVLLVAGNEMLTIAFSIHAAGWAIADAIKNPDS